MINAQEKNHFLKFQEWQKVREILAPDGPDEEAEKRERLKEKSLELQWGWHDNKKVCQFMTSRLLKKFY